MSPKHSTTSASAINPPAERMEKEDNTKKDREIDNLRKAIFDKERELTINQQRQD